MSKKITIGFCASDMYASQFEECKNIEQARTLDKELCQEDSTGYSEEEFDTIAEVNAYIKGIRDGSGWMGEPVFFTQKE